MQGKRQFRCVIWIINWALQIHCNPKVLLAANKLVSEDWTKTDHRVLQKIYVIWYSFWILGTSLVLLDFLKLSNFLSLDLVFPKAKMIYFWFQTMKNDWVWRKFLKGISPFSVFLSILYQFCFFKCYQYLRNFILTFKFLHWRIKNTFTTF